VTIGVFIAYLNDSYQWDLWTRLLREARARGVSLVGFCGHGLDAPGVSEATMNIAYRMAHPPCLDGIIVFSNTLGTFHGPGVVSRLLEGFDLPTVSLGFDLEGWCNISARGAGAMAELVRHLVHDHGRRRFALVTGPLGHQESVQREGALRETLAQEGLVLEQALLYRGTFYPDAGRKAVEAFLDAGLAFDAVVCLNDHMAIGAQQALRERGIRVPEDVSVTGFDDIEEAPWVSPPLTTVRQPLEALATGALTSLLELIGGREGASASYDCSTIFRQSCGCPPGPPLGLRGDSEGDPEALASFLETVARDDLPGILGHLARSVGSRWGNPRALDWWRCRILEHQGLGPGTGGRSRWSEQALAWLAEEELRWERESRMAQEEQTGRFRELSVRLLGLLNLEDIVRYGEDHFPSLGIPQSFLVLFERPSRKGDPEPPARARWLTTRGQASRRLTSVWFDPALLAPPVPGFLWGDSGWLVEPLVSQDEALGYLLLECGTGGAQVAETLREILSTAVKGALLMDEVRAHKANLEQQVQERTRELRAVHQDLQEVSNRTMQAIGQDIHDDLCQHLVGISMLASVAEETLAEHGVLSLASVREIRALVDSAVLRSRQFARTLYPPGLEEHGLVSALEDLVDTLGRPRGLVTFTTEGDCRLEGDAQALQLYRIVQESLSNAVRHSGSEVILVRLIRRPDGLLAEVRDFGKGLTSGAIGSGMGTRILRHRAESIGARLEIYNLEPGVCVSCFLGDQGSSHG